MSQQPSASILPPRTEGLARPDAVLWDMDGTLVDTEPHWFAAEQGLMHDHGLAWTDADSLELVGGDLEVSAQIMRKAGLPLGIRETVEALCARVAEGVSRQLDLRPGALELLVALRREGIPTALVTNSELPVASVVIDALHAIAGAGADPATAWDGPLFDLIVTGDIGLPVKPDPAPYTFAGRRLAALAAEADEQGAAAERPSAGRPSAEEPEQSGEPASPAAPALRIERMVAIEDSRTGIASGVASGAFVLGVPNAQDITGCGAHREAESLTGITAGTLGAWIRDRA